MELGQCASEQKCAFRNGHRARWFIALARMKGKLFRNKSLGGDGFHLKISILPCWRRIFSSKR